MTDRKQLRDEYESLCQRVAEILAQEDLLRIADENPDPVEEYSGEAAEIARRALEAERASRAFDQEYLARVVFDVFKSEFEVEIEAEEAARIASRVSSWFKQRP